MKKTYSKPTFELIKIKNTETVADGSGFIDGGTATTFKGISLSNLQNSSANFTNY